MEFWTHQGDEVDKTFDFVWKLLADRRIERTFISESLIVCGVIQRLANTLYFLVRDESILVFPITTNALEYVERGSLVHARCTKGPQSGEDHWAEVNKILGSEVFSLQPFSLIIEEILPIGLDVKWVDVAPTTVRPTKEQIVVVRMPYSTELKKDKLSKLVRDVSKLKGYLILCGPFTKKAFEPFGRDFLRHVIIPAFKGLELKIFVCVDVNETGDLLPTAFDDSEVMDGVTLIKSSPTIFQLGNLRILITANEKLLSSLPTTTLGYPRPTKRGLVIELAKQRVTYLGVDGLFCERWSLETPVEEGFDVVNFLPINENLGGYVYDGEVDSFHVPLCPFNDGYWVITTKKIKIENVLV